MKKLSKIIVGLMFIGLVGCEQSTEIQSSAYDDALKADFRSASEVDSIFSKDYSYFLGTIFFDEVTETHVISEDYVNIDAYLETNFGEDFTLDSLNVVHNYLYLYFSEGDVVYAEDVNISSGEWVTSSLNTGGGTTHKCDGGCGTIITNCNSCDFKRGGDGQITGCKCNHSPGFCCHTIEASMEPGPGSDQGSN